MANAAKQKALQDKFNDLMSRVKGNLDGSSTLTEPDKQFLQTLLKSWGSKLTRLINEYKDQNPAKELGNHPLFNTKRFATYSYRIMICWTLLVN